MTVRITGSYATGFNLGSIGTDVTVAAGATVSGAAFALYGAGSAAWSITNLGYLAASGDGIKLVASGAVTNSGTIVGGNFGVQLVAGGSVDNLNTGTISGKTDGVYIAGGTVTNAGTIIGGTDAVLFHSGGADRLIVDPGAVFGGKVMDAAGGGALELAAGAGAGTIAGLGATIVGFSQTTIDAGAQWVLDGTSGLPVGATLANAGTLTLQSGPLNGASVSDSGLLQNDVAIGGGTVGVSLLAGGTVVNLSGGTIAGSGEGILASGGIGTVVNAGSIGGSTYAVLLAAGFANRVIVDPGAVFTGTVSGGNSIGAAVVSTLELAAGAKPGVLSGFATRFVDFAATTIDAGAIWALNGSATLAASAGFDNAGTLTMANGNVLAPGSIVNTGLLNVYFGERMTVGALLGAGTVVVGSGQFGGTLDVTGSLAAAQSIQVDAGGVFQLGSVLLENDAALAAGTGADGVTLAAGETLVNLSGGIISGGNYGVYGGYGGVGAGFVTNAGTITGTNDAGVGLRFGGTVDNSAGTAVIYGGGNGITIYGAPGSVTNAGTIGGGFQYAVQLDAGGSVTNLAHGTIAGGVGATGVSVSGTLGSVTNAGLITGGVVLHATGGVDNLSTGTITGGVHLHSDATLTNAGTISAGTDAVIFAPGSVARVIVDPGAAFVGTVSGGNSIGAAAVSTLELAAGTIAGTITALGSQFVNFAQTTIDAGAQWTLAGANALAAGATLANAGTLTLADGTLAGAGTILNSGTIALPTGSFTVDAGTLAGAGALLVEGTAALTLNAGSVLPGQQIAFAPAPGITGGGTLTLDAPSGFAGTIAGYATGDQIVVVTTAAAGFAYTAGGSVIAVQDLVAGQPTGTQEGSLTFATPAAANQAYTDITNPTPSLLDQVAPCYAAGTRIATAHGEIAVERLRPGDLLRTAGGALRPVRWIGHRSINLTRHPDPRRAQPIRIRADAFADGIPARDLFLSPDHAVFDRGRLIPIRLLVNGATITRETRRRTVTYYHVELDSHDLLLAEGLAAESYLDCNNRGIFENAPEPLILHPDFYDPAAQAARRLAASCAPLIDAAELVAPLWWRLADRATALGLAVPSPRFTTDPGLKLRSGGRLLAPAARDGASFRFALPAGPATLLSRAAYPQDATPWLEDQRRLGVMVRALRLDGAPLPLDHPAFTSGWWAPETDGVTSWRWTDGAASLGTITAPATLEVTLGDTPRYPRAGRSRAA